MSNKAEGWSVGDRVAIFGPFGREPFSVGTVEKIYANGNLIVDRAGYRPSGPDVAHQTGEGFSRGLIRRLTPDLNLRVEKQLKLRKIRSIGDWLSRFARSDDVPQDVVERLTSLRRQAEQKEAD